MWSKVAGALLLASAVLSSADGDPLRIGFGHAPPMSHDRSGHPAGFTVDVLNEAARREGIQLAWARAGSSAETEQALEGGELDLMPAGIVTPRRQTAFYVSEPWWSAELYLLTWASSGIRAAADIRGKRLALASSIYASILEDSLPPARQVRLDSAADAMSALCRGDADAALLTQVDMQENALSRPEGCRGLDLRAVQTNVMTKLAVIARRDLEPVARRLRSRIDDMAVDGTLAAMATWHPPIPASAAVRMADTVRDRYELRTLGISLLSALLLLAVCGAFILRQRKTQQALRHKRELLQSLVDTIPVMIAIYDPQAGEFSPNREFERILGSPAAEARKEAIRLMQSAGPGWRDLKIPASDGGIVDSSWSGFRLSDGTLVGIGIDLRDRQRAEHDLRESYRRFATLVENIPDVVFRLDTSLRCVYISPAVQNRGLAPEDLIGKTIAEAAVPEDFREIFETECRTVLRTGAPRHFEAAIEERHERVRIVPEFGEDGSVVSLLGIGEDVTTAKRTERSLRDSERRWSLAVEYAGLGLWDIDLKSGKTIWTRRLYEVLGYEPGSVEPTSELWQSRLHPDDRARVLEAVARARRERSLYSCLYRAIRADNGAVVWLDAYGRFEYEDGEATRFIGVFVDATHRKRAEAELEAIMDAVPAAIFIARDPECSEILGSRMTYDLLRAPAGSNLSEGGLRARFRLMKGGRELRPEDLPVQTAARTGQPVCDYELDVACEDGTERRLFGNAVPLLDEAGRPRGAVAAFTEVTELKRMEERLRQSQKLESIGLLAGGVAHDFNNILVTIVGNASLARDMLPSSNPARELMQQVIGGGERAAHLTRQMLAYAGKGRFVLELVDLTEVAQETVLLAQPSFSKKIAVHLEPDPVLPPVEADRSQIQQVVMNLVLNAAEAVGERAGVIALRTGATELDRDTIGRELDAFDIAPGHYVFLEVRDTGCGMDPDTKARIFDPFFTTKFTGRGLGLAAVAGIVRTHKGAIRVISAPGQGSTFQALFPAAAGSAQRPALSSPEDEEDLTGSGTVLIVDDEQGVRNMAARVLQTYGYTALGAEDGPAAIEVFRQEALRVRAVVLDLSMPGMSGEEVLPELRKIRADVPVIVSSGYSEMEALRLFTGTPVAGFIQKPYTSRQLARKIKSAVRASQQAAQG